MDQIPQNIAETLLAQATREAECRVSDFKAHDGEDVSVLIARDSVKATILQSNLDAFAAVPRSRAGKVRALDLDSFASLILRDYDAGSVVFADVSGAGVSFEAVLDYHGSVVNAAPVEHTARGGQRHGREVVFYDPALSDEWVAWTKQANKPMTQGEFAAWIDEHLPDLADPRHLADAGPENTAVKFGSIYGFTAQQLYGYADPEAMVKLSRGLEIREQAAVKNFVRLETGEVSVSFETTQTDKFGADLKVPTRFLLSIPVFKREDAYLVPVKLSYRKAGANLSWSFDLFRPDRFRDDAIEGMRRSLALKLTPAITVGNLKPAPVVPIHLAKRTAS